MTPERWRRVEQLYDAALAQHADGRTAFVVAACGPDEELRREVESLLAQARQVSAFIETPAIVIAADLLAADDGASFVGRKLGPYIVRSLLGAGGMGAVYRATDTKLGRDVAIKILPESFACDPDRLARFEREAMTLASLNHPNIAHIHGLEESGGVRALVLELVEGEDLSQRVARGAVPLDEALPMARQIADALEAAHDQAIIHRDLKPANIMVRTDGTVKILDFGLAKALEPASSASPNASQSPTHITPVMTQAGTILGTAAYMSPEQAKGGPADKRSDLWAFGAVLYEILTGTRAFPGDGIAETLAHVLTQEPDWTALPADTPAAIRRLLGRCLERDRRRRLDSAAAARLEIEDAAKDQTILPPFSSSAQTLQRLPWILAALVTLAASAALIAWTPWRSARAAERPLVRLDVTLARDGPPGSSVGPDVVISPDGARLVFVSNGRLFTRRLDQPTAVELTGTIGAFAPFFSPDGHWIAFFAGGELKKISVDGGSAVILAEAPNGRGGSWSDDGTIVASLNGTTLARLSDGGKPTKLTDLAEGESLHAWPQILPGGKAVLFSVRPASRTFDEGHIDVLSIRDGHRATVLRNGMFGRYLATSRQSGYLLYVNKGTLFGVPFDLDRLELRGNPSPVLEGVRYDSRMGSAQMDASADGTLVYRAGAAGGLVTLQWLDEAGNIEPLPARPALFGHPRVSPDGKQIALTVNGPGGQDIWVYDWQRDAMSRLTFGGGTFDFPVWHPSGRYIVFTGGYSGSGGMFWTRADGSIKPQRLTEGKNGQFPWSFSPDGTRLAFADYPPGVQLDIWTVPVENDGTSLKAAKPEVFLQTAANELYPAFSPDGRWIAYRSNESGTDEVYVRAFPDTGSKWLISNNGGIIPVWSRNGHELFYRTADQRIMAVAYTVNGDAFVAERPHEWTNKRLAEMYEQNFDRAADGSRFLALMPASAPDEQTRNHVIFLQNFVDEIRRRVGEHR